MYTLEAKNYTNSIQRLGRTLDGSNGELYMNWTCSGLRFNFKGACLLAELSAYYGEEYENPFDRTTGARKTWPYIAVFIDDAEEPVSYFEVNGGPKNYLIFSSKEEERHIITLRKMTENPKGKLSVNKFITDGIIEKVEDDREKLMIEFIGDSITCGFGNLAKERDRLFYSVDENGWFSHAAVAARILKAQFSIISYSGIAVSKGLGNIDWKAPCMPELYPYADKLLEESQGEITTFTEWDFKQSKPDVIVLNLGTNDAAVIEFNGDISRGIQKFEEDYYHFMKMLRDKNGEEPWIICTLGSMDYYLFDNIAQVVERFCKENKDDKIRCFKYGRMRLLDGYGACGHPSLSTQIRMGQEIADYINELMN
ncbi:MAG: hydrolase family protein [Herbinix sp.]|jgi:lysophospholipase L1-like esterase|nr:hydrolase family protein [Herbinix sp.]